MCIKIETEKVVDGAGELCRKITKIDALPEHRLPEMYLQGDTVVYKWGTELCVKAGTFVKWYDTCKLYREKEFQRLLGIVYTAGDNLKKCNEILAKRRSLWNGEETFYI